MTAALSFPRPQYREAEACYSAAEVAAVEYSLRQAALVARYLAVEAFRFEEQLAFDLAAKSEFRGRR
jgi:hypothetical protein